MKKKTPEPAQTVSPVQTQALQQSQQDMQARNTQLGQVNQTVDQAKPVLNRITSMDANGSTPLRQALTNSKTSATNAAYNNAASVSRLKGLQAGLQNQPMQVGNEVALENQRAGALGHIPGEVEQEAGQQELQATGLMNSLANTQLGAAGQYSPESYFSTGAGMETSRQNNLEQEYQAEQARKGSLWKGLASAGLGLAFAPMTGGGSLLGNALGGGKKPGAGN